MADNRQKRKQFLSARRPIVTVARLNVSFWIDEDQWVAVFLFLSLKATCDRDRRRSAPQDAGDGGGVTIPCQNGQVTD